MNGLLNSILKSDREALIATLTDYHRRLVESADSFVNCDLGKVGGNHGDA